MSLIRDLAMGSYSTLTQNENFIHVLLYNGIYYAWGEKHLYLPMQEVEFNHF